MPARPRIPDPYKGELERFAFDLRQLGAGKASVSWIAKNEGRASRPALYAALSGTRLPSSTTVSALLRWWAGNPDAEREGRPSDAVWGWIYRLPDDLQATAKAWQERYSNLVHRENIRRVRYGSEAPVPVQISVPEEQQAFIAELRKFIRRTELFDDYGLFMIFPPGALLRIERYLDGKVIPNDTWCVRIVEICIPFMDDPDFDPYDDLQRLQGLAERARQARARDRRIARKEAFSAKEAGDGASTRRSR